MGDALRRRRRTPERSSLPNSSAAGATARPSNSRPTSRPGHRPGPQPQHQLHLRRRPPGPAALSARTSAASIPATPSAFDGRLINRRRIIAPRLALWPVAPPENQPADPAELDKTDRGIIFMALNASLSRQFEFVQQQWISYGNDAHLGNEKDLLIGNHGDRRSFGIQGDTTAANPPFVCIQPAQLRRAARRRLLLHAQHHRAGHARHEPCRPALERKCVDMIPIAAISVERR